MAEIEPKSTQLPTFSEVDESPVTVIIHPRKLDMYRVIKNELQDLRLAGSYAMLDVALFALCIGVFISFLVALITDPPPAGTILSDVFVMTTVVTGLACIFFGIRSIIAWRKTGKVLDGIAEE